MDADSFYSRLEQEFELIHDNYRYMNKFQTDDEEIAQIARFCSRKGNTTLQYSL